MTLEFFAVLTGLRRGDILSLTRENLTDEGVAVITSKTEKPLLIEWSPTLRSIVKRPLAIRPQVRQSVICNRSGKSYTPDGFSSVWDSLMHKAMKHGSMERFQFRDLRAKSASEDTLEAATARLCHVDSAITERVYRRKPAKVRPLR